MQTAVKQTTQENLSRIVDKCDTGLYRDDGLLILRNANDRKADNTRKEIVKMFKDIGFQIEIQTNLKIVNFLDITLDLNTNTYRPYKKPNDTLLYIHTSSNHPKQIINQLPETINKRLSKNSSNATVFEKSKTEYEEALQKSGYKNVTLTYQKENTTQKRKNRKRNIIWFNPPFNKNVSTNVAKTFLSLIDKHFPISNKLHKIFNRNNIKVSYSCTKNVERIIKSHNRNVTSKDQAIIPPCNCRNKDNCPLNGKCRSSNAVYKCDVITPNQPSKTYIGLAEGEWKKRYNNHTQSITHKRYAKSTTLSSYIWEIKDNHHVTPSLSWSIVKSVPAYSNLTKRCLLCLHEKLAIITYPRPDELLNKRSELISKCRHENKFLLANYKSKD